VVRLAPLGLVFAAGLADQAGAHMLAFNALLVAVPLTAAAALRTVAERIDGKAEQAQGYFWGVALALLLVATAVRAPALADPGVPSIGRSALLACIAVFCLQAVATLAHELRKGPS
jgi:hypothetical protein